MKKLDNEKIPPDDPRGIKNLQLGCGPKHLRENWWNTDLRPFEGIDETLDAAGTWRWRDELSHIYAEHFIEHLNIEDAFKLLSNSWLALKPGGHIRFSTPSLEWVWASHLTLPADDDSKLVGETLASNRAFHGWGHKFLWSRPILQRTLEASSFINVRFCEYGKSEIEELRNLELHPLSRSSQGYESVWIVEATKGSEAQEIDETFFAFIHQEYTRHVRSGH